MNNFKVIKSPLISHKLALLRDKNTPTAEFRRVVKEIAMLEGYEVLTDMETELPLEKIEVETPIEKTEQTIIKSKDICFVPILRAGMGMVDGFSELLPNASVGHIGLYRDEITHEPHAYYCNLPQELENKKVILIDPMLATGGSSIDAVKILKEHGAKHITFVCMIAAPEGVKAFTEKYPDIHVYAAALDRQLNEKAYICPGLGDAGDRIFGTVKR